MTFGSRTSPDDLDDALDMMEPMFQDFLKIVTKYVPDDDELELGPIVAATLGALAKTAASVIDSVYGPDECREVLKRYACMIICALQMFEEERKRGDDDAVPQNQ